MLFEETFTGRPNTIRTYKSLFKTHIQPHLVESNLNIGAWGELQTLAMVNMWEQKGLSPRTKITLLRILNKFVIFNGGSDLNIQPKIRMLKRSTQEKEVTALTAEQAEHLMSVCQILEPNFYPVLLLALHGGLRRGEVFGLRCGDIDMLKGRLRVAHSYKGPTKNGKTRYVPISKELGWALTGARNILIRPTDDIIFEKHDPNPILHKLCKRAKIPIINFHDLRHTFATLALEDGVSPRQVQAWLGHSSVATTLGIYWNLVEETSNLDFLPTLTKTGDNHV